MLLDGVDAFEELVAFAEAFQSTHLDQRFNGFFIQVLGFHAFDELFEAFIFPFALALFDDFFDDDMPDIFDGVQSETHPLYLTRPARLAVVLAKRAETS